MILIGLYKKRKMMEDNLGGWLVTGFAFIVLLWSFYSIYEFDKKEKHG